MLNIAVIGAGRIGQVHARTIASHPGAVLALIADPFGDAAEKLAAVHGARHTTDIDSVFTDDSIDAVIIGSPTPLHIPHLLAAAKAGKAVLCEKPMAISEDECRDMIEAAERAAVKLQIGFMRRFDAGHVHAKRLVEDGAIGEVVAVKSLTHGPSVPHPWMYDLKASNGPLAEVSSHDIDAIRWLSGSEVVDLQAFAGNYRCPDARAEFPDFYDTVMVNARFANGALGHVDGAHGVRYGYDNRVEIHGTHGRIDIGDVSADRVVVHEETGRSSRDIVASWRDLYREAYIAEDRAFAQAIAEGTPVRVSGEDGLAAVRIVCAGNASIASGAIQRLTPPQ